MFPRRYLPALQLLSAFDAVARFGSITSAAGELSLTQSAVSRQLITLEKQIGASLFQRRRNRLHLTKQGEVYLAQIRPALDQISNATVSLAANPDGGALSLAILPTFGTHWLAPKLPDFLAQHPGVTINLSTHLEPFDFQNSAFDAAIFHGHGDWPETECIKLLDEKLIAACAPEFLTDNPIDNAGDLMRLPLLSIATRSDAWGNWFKQHGIDHQPLKGMIFDQFATLAQAAKHGMGVALLPWFLIADDLRTKKLLPAFGDAMAGSDAYYLVWPKHRASYPPVQKLVKWLKSAT